MRFGQVGPQRQAAAKRGDGTGKIIFVFQRQPEVVMRLGVIRRQRQQLVVIGNRRVVIRLTGKKAAATEWFAQLLRILHLFLHNPKKQCDPNFCGMILQIAEPANSFSY